MLKKGDSSVIMVLVLVLLGAGLYVATVVSGPLADAILEGHEKTEKNTDFVIEVHDEKTLSDLAMFVYHRGSNDGCADSGKKPTVKHQIDGNLKLGSEGGIAGIGTRYNLGRQTSDGNGGYPGLENTYLGRYPDCFDQKAAPGARGIGPLAQDPGKDQEGIFSREKFEVKEKVTFDATSPDGEIWLEHTMLAGSEMGLKQRIVPECSGTATYPIYYPGGQFGVGTSLEYRGTNKGEEKYIWFFESGGENRLQPSIESAPTDPFAADDAVYCSTQNSFGWGLVTIPDSGTPIEGTWNTRDFKVTLCEGDEGYVQLNKGSRPDHEGEAAEHFGADKAYPMIVITHTEKENCGASGSLKDYGGAMEGQALYVQTDNPTGYDNMGRATWPGVDRLELGSLGPFVGGLVPDASNFCWVRFVETDAGMAEKGVVAYGKGMVLDYNGGFKNLLYVEGKHLPDNKPIGGGHTTEWLYKNAEFKNEGIADVNSGVLNKEFTTGSHIGEMYGDLICADPTGGGPAKWYLCEKGDGSAIAGDSVTADGTNYQCDPSTGNWNPPGGP